MDEYNSLYDEASSYSTKFVVDVREQFYEERPKSIVVLEYIDAVSELIKQKLHLVSQYLEEG